MSSLTWRAASGKPAASSASHLSQNAANATEDTYAAAAWVNEDRRLKPPCLLLRRAWERAEELSEPMTPSNACSPASSRFLQRFDIT